MDLESQWNNPAHRSYSIAPLLINIWTPPSPIRQNFCFLKWNTKYSLLPHCPFDRQSLPGLQNANCLFFHIKFLVFLTSIFWFKSFLLEEMLSSTLQFFPRNSSATPLTNIALLIFYRILICLVMVLSVVWISLWSIVSHLFIIIYLCASLLNPDLSSLNNEITFYTCL